MNTFDRYQFYKRARPVSAKSEITYSDYDRMRTVNGSVSRRNKMWIPEFAYNNEQLKAVILECEARNRKGINNGSREIHTHLTAVKRAGSFRAFSAAIAYRAWRLGNDGIGIAAEMGITPTGVRRHINRMVRIAEFLGFKTYEKHHPTWTGAGRILDQNNRSNSEYEHILSSYDGDFGEFMKNLGLDSAVNYHVGSQLLAHPKLPN
jgi:hypothetical protein